MQTKTVSICTGMENLRIMDVKVLSILNAGSFMGFAQDNSEESCRFESMSSYTNEHYRNEKPLRVEIQSPDPNKIYCVKSPSNKSWCRTVVQTVLQTAKEPLAKCYLIDCDKIENINLRWLRECPSEFRVLPTQARKYTLYGIQPISMKTDVTDFTTSLLPSNKWDEAADTFVRQKLKDLASVKVEVWRETDEEVQVLVFLAGPKQFLCVNNMLVEEQYAIHTDDAIRGRTLPIAGITQDINSEKGDLDMIFEKTDTVPPQVVNQVVPPRKPDSEKGDLEKIFGPIEKVPTQVLKQYVPPRQPVKQQPSQREANISQRVMNPQTQLSHVPSETTQPSQFVMKGDSTVSAVLASLGKSSPVHSSDEQSPPRIIRRRTPRSNSPKKEPARSTYRSTAELALSGDVRPKLKTQLTPEDLYVRKPTLSTPPHVGRGDAPVKCPLEPQNPGVTYSTSVGLTQQPVRLPQMRNMTSIGHGQVPSASNPLTVPDLPSTGRGYGRGSPFREFSLFNSLASESDEESRRTAAASSPQVDNRVPAAAGFTIPQLHHPPQIHRTATAELPKPFANNSPSPPRPVGGGRGKGLAGCLIKPGPRPTSGSQQTSSFPSQNYPNTPFVQPIKPDTSLHPVSNSSLEHTSNPSDPLPSCFPTGSNMGAAGHVNQVLPNSRQEEVQRQQECPSPALSVGGSSTSGDFDSPVQRADDRPNVKPKGDDATYSKKGIIALLKNPLLRKLLPSSSEELTTEKTEALLDLINALEVLQKDKDDNSKSTQEQAGRNVPQAESFEMPSLCGSDETRNDALEEGMSPLSAANSVPEPVISQTAVPEQVPGLQWTGQVGYDAGSVLEKFQAEVPHSSQAKVKVVQDRHVLPPLCGSEDTPQDGFCQNAAAQSLVTEQMTYQACSASTPIQGQMEQGSDSDAGSSHAEAPTPSPPRLKPSTMSVSQMNAEMLRHLNESKMQPKMQPTSNQTGIDEVPVAKTNIACEYGLGYEPKQLVCPIPDVKGQQTVLGSVSGGTQDNQEQAELLMRQSSLHPDDAGTRKPVVTSPSMYERYVTGRKKKGDGVDSGLHQDLGDVEQPEQGPTTSHLGNESTGTRRHPQLSPNMMPSPLDVHGPSSQSVCNLIPAGHEEDDQMLLSGSDSGSACTGSKLMSRLPKIATIKKVDPVKLPAATTSVLPTMIIGQLEKSPQTEVNLKLPTPSDEYELKEESDSGAEIDEERPTIRRDCHRGRRLLEIMNPEHYERQCLKQLMSNLHVDIEMSFATEIKNDSGILIDGEIVPTRPATTLDFSNLGEYIKNRLVSKEFRLPTMIQSWCWPAILRGLNVIGIAPPKRGKTLAYLAPLGSLILQTDTYADLPPGSGPKAVIVAASWASAHIIFDQCKMLIGDLRDAKMKLIFGDGDEENIMVDLMNGCDILIATPHCLNRMLAGEYTNFERLCHLVFDDADTLMDGFNDEVHSIINTFDKVIEETPDRTAPRQIMAFSSQWTPGIHSFQNKCLQNPAVIIWSSFEAAVYGGVKQIPDVCPSNQRFQKLPSILEELSPNHKKIIIFTNTPTEAEEVYKLLQTYCYHAILYTHAMLTGEIEQIKSEWAQPHDEQSKPVLVMTDGGIPELHITDATCVIHYTMSETKTKFGNRLGCMEDHLKANSREEGKELVSYILISPDCGRQSPTLVRLLRRIGVEPPRNLELLAAGVMEGREEGKQQPLCHYLKAYGRCRDVNKCPARHVISAEIDQPDPEVPMPKNGEVKVLITHVVNACHYYARIQEHKQYEPDGKITKNTEFARAASMLHFEVLKHFQTESRRVHYTNPKVGDLCAVDDRRGVFSRARVLQVPRKVSEKTEIEVIYIDEGRTQSVRLKHLYELPEHLHLDNIAPTVVEIYIPGLKPKDEDIEWTTKASLWVYQLINGMELNGTIVLSLGTTLWLENLTHLTYLSQLKETIHQYCVRKELLVHKMAVKNPEHMPELYKLCQGKVDIPLLTVPKKDGIPKYTYSLGSIRTEVLPESEMYHKVCVSAVRTPHLFFIQKIANKDAIESMDDEINSDVDSLEPVDPNMITSGMLCLAKFSQTERWYRAQVMSMKEKNYNVFFVDYGDSESVPVDCMRTLSEKYAKLPLQAIECSLVKVSPTGTGVKWDEAAADAFWDMTGHEDGDRKILYATIKSHSEASFSGIHKCHIELIDTDRPEEELLLSQELVSAGHALASPESREELFPDLDLDLEVEAEEYERIPFYCARMFLNTVASEAIHLAQACKDAVAEYNRRELLKADAHLAMCKVMAHLPEQTSQYLLLQALSSLLDEDSAKEDAYQNGAVKAFCRILRSGSSSTLSQIEVAKILVSFSFDHRYCFEVGVCDGIKNLCTLAGSVKQEHICRIFLICLSNICHGYPPNCEILKDSGGLRILSKIVTRSDDKENMKCVLDLLQLLVENLESTEAMRKDDVIEALVTNLARTAHIDLIGDIVSLLSTLAGHSRANAKAMREENISEALEKHCQQSSRCSEDVKMKCKELYGIFNPGGYVDPEHRQPVGEAKQVNDEAKQMNGHAHIENTPIIEDIIPSRRALAEALWTQKLLYVVLTIKVPGVKEEQIDCMYKRDEFTFRAAVQETEYYLELQLHQTIVPGLCKCKVTPSSVIVALRKEEERMRWPRLLKFKGKPANIKVDMDHYVDTSSESEEEPDESPFTFRQKKSIGDILAADRSSVPKYINARPDPVHVVESSDSDSECDSDAYDESVMKWADKDPFDIFGDY